MSKNIPKVRRWRVRYWNEKTLLYSIVVDAPNKQFARWAARDKYIASGAWEDIAHSCERITVSLYQSRSRITLGAHK